MLDLQFCIYAGKSPVIIMNQLKFIQILTAVTPIFR